MKARDSQRKRVYAAENAAFAGCTGMRDVSAQSKSQARINEIMASKWMADHYPRATLGNPPVVNFIPRLRSARADGREIDIGGTEFARTEWVLMHELGHSINHRVNHDACGHGWQYCSIYLALVRRFMSALAADALKDEFRKHRVRYNKPRVRAPLSAEQRSALAARLAVHRKPAVKTTLWERVFAKSGARGYITHNLADGHWLRLYVMKGEYVFIERLSGSSSRIYTQGCQEARTPGELDALVYSAEQTPFGRW